MLDKKMTKQEKREARINDLPLTTQVVSMINTLIYFLYLGICRAALSIFNCVDTKPITGRKYLAAEPMEECGDPRGVQVKLTIPAICVLIFYCIGFPAYVMIVFWRRKKRIIADQTLRAHGRGEDQATNKNYGTRKMFGKLYFPYQPTKYWWALIVIVKKFLLVFFGIYFRNYPTFQMAITLFVVFVAFSIHVDHDPFLGMLEKAKIVREEAEETILREIKKLERAQLLVRINGKAYYQLMHSMRIQIDEQEALMAKHAFSPFNYNVVESILLMTACIIVLAGIMFDSDYILERLIVPEYEIRGKVITYMVLVLFVFSVIYYLVVVVHEFCVAAKRRRTTRQLMWAKIKANSSKIRGMGSKILAGHKMKVGEVGPDGKEVTVVGAAAFNLFQAKKQNRFLGAASASAVHPAGAAGKFNRAMVVPMSKQKIQPTLPRQKRPDGSGASSDDNMSFDGARFETKTGTMLAASNTPMAQMEAKRIGLHKHKKGSKHRVRHSSDSESESDSSSSVHSDTPSESSLSSDSDSDVLADFNHAVDKIQGSGKSQDTMEIRSAAPVLGKEGNNVHQHKHHAKNADGTKIHKHKHHDLDKDGNIVHKHKHSATTIAESQKKRKQLEKNHSGSDESVSSGSSNSSGSSHSSGSSGSDSSDSDSDHNSSAKGNKSTPQPPQPPPPAGTPASKTAEQSKSFAPAVGAVEGGKKLSEGKQMASKSVHQHSHHEKDANGKIIHKHHHSSKTLATEKDHSGSDGSESSGSSHSSGSSGSNSSDSDSD